MNFKSEFCMIYYLCEAKMIEAFILAQEREVASALTRVHEYIMQNFDHVEEAMSYGLPTYKWKGKNLLHIGVFKSHIGFYPGPEALVAFAHLLSGYKRSKGTLQVNFLQELPFDAIVNLINFRAKQILAEHKK